MPRYSLSSVWRSAGSVREDELTGDTRYACEALLCLSSGIRPGECSPSLSRYFGITRKKWKDTLNARRDFLRLCPVSSDPGMPSLVEAIVNGGPL